MVKSPKIRHSKSGTEPVTIDLSADEVSRIPPDQAKPAGVSDAATAGPADTGKAAEASRPANASRKSEGSTKPAEQPARTASPASPVPPVGNAARTTGTAAPQKPAEPPQPSQSDPKAAPGAASSAFGRDATKPSPPPRPQAPPRPGAGSLVAAGLLGGGLVLAGAAGAWYGGLLSTPQIPAATGSGETAALRSEIESLRSEMAELRTAQPVAGGDSAGLTDANARIESLGVLVEEMRNQLAQLAESAGAGGSPADRAEVEELRSALAALQERVAALPAGGGVDAEALRGEIARIEESIGSAVQSAASATEAAGAAQSRMDTLEQSIAQLTARLDEQDKTPGVALAIAASALKAAIDRGTPFTTELETYAGLAPKAPEVAALREMAASGVPTRAAVAAEADAVAIRMIDAGRVIDPNAGFLDRLWASAQSLVTVRPVGDVEGSDVPAVVARWEAALDAGDYERAISEFETLPADAKAAGAAFMDKVRARHSADRLVDQTLAAALRA
jgi:hypothetical protein